jgi:hypothetical protein
MVRQSCRSLPEPLSAHSPVTPSYPPTLLPSYPPTLRPSYPPTLLPSYPSYPSYLSCSCSCSYLSARLLTLDPLPSGVSVRDRLSVASYPEMCWRGAEMSGTWRRTEIIPLLKRCGMSLWTTGAYCPHHPGYALVALQSSQGWRISRRKCQVHLSERHSPKHRSR